MTREYHSQCVELQKRIPISLRYGLQLLQETNGNIAAAVQLFQSRQIELLSSKEKIHPKKAQKYLEENQYQYAKARKALRPGLHPFHANQEPEEKLHALAQAIKKTLGKRDWFLGENLPQGNSSQSTFLVVWEWVVYEDWENFNTAIDLVSTNTVIQKMEIQLGLVDLADALRKAQQRQQILSGNHRQNNLEDYVDVVNTLREDPEYKEAKSQYAVYRDDLIQALLKWVQSRIEDFPIDKMG